jgi:tRNA uridine 5-carboxymethylaminomethyl modification enzyme
MNNSTNNFDVIVVGGGHAGIEAAHAAAKMGSKVLLISINIQRIGWMSCNPAIGGLGKSHIVYEISALGGLMPQLCTKTYLQSRMLNTKKGPAVQGLRLQIDKEKYATLSQECLTKLQNLTILQATVDDLIIENNVILGVVTDSHEKFFAPCVVITAGTFLRGVIHIGSTNYPGGRVDDPPANHLSPNLAKHGLQIGRLKTGTPPRLLRSSLDFSKMEKQEADQLDYLFEFYPHKTTTIRDCYITYTNEETHRIIRENLTRSALFGGFITGVGPRYCPSIEDKISRFASKNSHHVFVEPESVLSDDIYPNGLSTSLPADVQEQYIRSVAGFESAVITKSGYAIEYDFVYPQQLKHTLETKRISGLFLAGQVNGTTGYEEAAGQGLIAGINAHKKAHNVPPLILTREQSYIGIMIDDLVTLGVDEPYRMFTSRAERRITLRQDNVFLRLMDTGYNLGLVDKTLYDDFCHERDIITSLVSDLRKKYTTGQLLKIIGEKECNKQAVQDLCPQPLSARAVLTIYAEIKYYEYLVREQREIVKAQKYRELDIAHVDFKGVPGLSRELQDKLAKHKPQNIAQAMLIPGMTPAAIALLIFKTREATQ